MSDESRNAIEARERRTRGEPEPRKPKKEQEPERIPEKDVEDQ
jgi:hypothetical protein